MTEDEKSAMSSSLLRVERIVVTVEEAVVFVILASLLVTLSLQIASRFVFEFPLDWTEELARVGQMWLVFIGAAVGARRAEHFVVEIFMERVHFPGKALVARVIDVLVVGFFLVLALVSGWMAWFGAIQIMPALGASVAWGYAAIPAGCTLIAFHFVCSWLRPVQASVAAVEAGE
jgi:TRAP-type C4-dicarboxylate transport system permease small subunit